MIRIALVLGLALAGCFSPTLTECAFRCAPSCPEGTTCGGDGFCHGPDDTRSCALLPPADSGIDAVLVDARPRPDANLNPDAPLVIPDARIFDASLLPDAPRPDAGPLPVDARPPADAPAGTPDARDCGPVCDDERACGNVNGCQCGSCFDAEWCGDNCGFAICEEQLCCLPEASICDVGAGQCCAGLTCVTFCVLL